MNLQNLDSLWDYNDPQATAIKFRALLPAAEIAEDRSFFVQLLTQLARTQSLQQNYDEAHTLLDTAAKVIAGQVMPVAEIHYLLERGRTYNSAGEKSQSIPLFEEAYRKAVTHKEDFYAIDAAHMLGIAVKPQEQLFWNTKAIDLAEKTTDTRAGKWLGSLYNNIGWTHHNLKDYPSALTFFEKLLTWRRDHEDERGIFMAKWTIGRTYRSLHRFDEALAIQKELWDEIQQKGLTPSGYVFEELAECLLIKDRPGEAKVFFRQAYDILSKDVWLNTYEGARLQRLKDLGV